MSTAIAQWGNSSAVRIPAKVLSQSGLKLGNLVEPIVNQQGNIELVAAGKRHRRVIAPGRITSDQLYKRFPAGLYLPESEGWPSDDMVGAELESWSN